MPFDRPVAKNLAASLFHLSANRVAGILQHNDVECEQNDVREFLYDYVRPGLLQSSRTSSQQN